MKCPCGYHYEPEYNRDETYNGSNVPFIKIKGSYFIEADSNLYNSYNREVSLYACPECGTIKMEKY